MKHPFWRAYRDAFVYWRREWLGFLCLLIGAVGLFQGGIYFDFVEIVHETLINLTAAYPSIPGWLDQYVAFPTLLIILTTIIILMAMGLLFHLTHILQSALVLRRLGLLTATSGMLLARRTVGFTFILLLPYIIFAGSMAYAFDLPYDAPNADFTRQYMLGIVGIGLVLVPLINVFMYLTVTILLAEGSGLGKAIRRSATLIRHHFWKLSLFKLVTYPMVPLLAITAMNFLSYSQEVEQVIAIGIVLFLASYPAYLAPALYQTLTAQTELVPENVELVFD